MGVEAAVNILPSCKIRQSACLLFVPYFHDLCCPYDGYLEIVVYRAWICDHINTKDQGRRRSTQPAQLEPRQATS